MRKVAIAGAYQTRHGKFVNKSLREFVTEAGLNAIRDSKIPKSDIQAVFVGNYAGNEFNGQNAIAPFVASVLGLEHSPSTHLEGACASGGLAVRQAYLTVAAGFYDTVLVLGVEKMNTTTPENTMEIVARGQDQDFEGSFFISGPSGFALYANRHMHEFGTTKKQLAHVAEKNYFHGSMNPDAHKQRKIDLERIIKAPMVSSPFGLHDVSLVTDAAAALVVTTAEKAKEYGADAIEIAGSGHGAESFTMALKKSATGFTSTQMAAKEAYERAGVSAQDIDVVECHDCFTVTEIINVEDLGFVEKGKGGPFTEEGNTRLGGKIPVNTSGGLKAKGHPIGATGVGQLVEVSRQLRGVQGERQVKGAEIGLTHVLGGPGSVSTVHVLKKI